MVRVNGRDGRAVGAAISKLRRQLEDTGKLDEYRERQAYVKPSVRARKKHQLAVLRGRRPERARWYVQALDGTVYHDGAVVEVAEKQRKRGRRGRGKRGPKATFSPFRAGAGDARHRTEKK